MWSENNYLIQFSTQIQRLGQTYEDLYFGDDIVKEYLQEDEQTLPLLKRRSNCGCLINQGSNSFQYIYSDIQGSCLSGVQFKLNEEILEGNLCINIKKVEEFAPLKKTSKIVGIDKIAQGGFQYLRVRSLYGIQHLPIINNKLQISSKKSVIFEEEELDCREVLDCVQSQFFDDEQYVLCENNSLFQLNKLEEVIFKTKLTNLKAQIESIETSFHPLSILLQMTDEVQLYDFRSQNPSSILKVPEKKVPLSRLYAIKQLEDNYFMVSTTQHMKVYDIRCTNYPVISVSHGSDEAPPTVCNIQDNKKFQQNEQQEDEDGEDENESENQDDKDDEDSFSYFEESPQRQQIKLITAFSPHHGGNAVFMKWIPGHTLVKSIFQNQQDNNSDNEDSINNDHIQSQSSANFSASANHYNKAKKLNQIMTVGREAKGERLGFYEDAKRMLQPKGLFVSSNISNFLKIRGLSTAFFNDQEKFIAVQSDSKGGVTAQVFQNQGNNPICYIPIRINADQSRNTAGELERTDPQLHSVVNLQIKKMFEQTNNINRYNNTSSELLTEPLKKKSNVKKQVNMYPYFSFLRDSADNVKQTFQEEIKELKQKKQKKESAEVAAQGEDQRRGDSQKGSKFSQEQTNISKDIFQNSQRMMSTQDKEGQIYPEFKKSTKYNNKRVLTEKNMKVLQSFWDD